MNFLENHYKKTKFSRYFQKPTPRPKIDLDNDSKMEWIKKNEFKCFVSYTCLRACATNAWYFDSGCSRHMTGDKNILVDYKLLSEGLVNLVMVSLREFLVEKLLMLKIFNGLRMYCMLMGLRLI